MKYLALFITLMVACGIRVSAAPWANYEGKEGPGHGKHIVFLTGDEEYRGEESLPQMARILSQRHGFKCTVLFSQDPDGTINPNNSTNVPGMHLLGSADLVVNQFRFRELPDADMKHLVDYMNSGKPMIVIRTATHPFNYTRNKQSPYARFSYAAKGGGWGGLTIGETWTYHHGNHGSEGTRGLVDGKNRQHPILRGVNDVFGPTDIYGVNADFPADATVLMHGQALKGLKPEDPPNLNKAIMPMVWLRDYKGETGKTAKYLTTTIGASVDMLSEDLRRLVVNASYWLTSLDVPKKADVTVVGEFKPTFFGNDKFKKGLKPSDLELK